MNFYCLWLILHTFLWHEKPVLFQAYEHSDTYCRRQNRLHVYQNSTFILHVGNSDWPQTRTKTSSETLTSFEFIKVLEFASGVWDDLCGERERQRHCIYLRRNTHTVHARTHTHWNRGQILPYHCQASIQPDTLISDTQRVSNTTNTTLTFMSVHALTLLNQVWYKLFILQRFGYLVFKAMTASLDILMACIKFKNYICFR